METQGSNRSIESLKALISDGNTSHWLNSASMLATGVGLLMILICNLLYNDEGDTWANIVLSSVINLYLCWRYPIKSTNGKNLPSCPYRFPNGQGNMLKFFEGDKKAKIWQEKYGSVYRIWSGFSPEVVLTRSDQIQTVFRDSNMHVKAHNMDSGWLIGEILGQCLGLLNLDDWARVRAAVAGPFHQSKSASYVSLIQGRIESHFSILKEANAQEKDVLKIRPAQDFKMFAFWILGDIIYGGLSEDMQNRLLAIIPEREKLWNGVMAGGLARFGVGKTLPIPLNHSLAVFQMEWAEFNKQAYERARKENPEAPIYTMHAAVEDGRLSNAELLQTLDEMLFANLDVTIGNLAWNPIFLAARPDVQDELRDEIRRARNNNNSGDTSWETYITSTSTLLMACVLESARLKPIIPFSQAQAAPTDRHVDDWVIPAGTNIVLDTYSVNVLDPYWGTDNMMYRPKRFLEARSATEKRYRFWRYGFGPRQCLGKSVADLVLKSFVAFLVENYWMELGGKESQSSSDWERDADLWVSSPTQEIVCKEIQVSQK